MSPCPGSPHGLYLLSEIAVLPNSKRQLVVRSLGWNLINFTVYLVLPSGAVNSYL